MPEQNGSAGSWLDRMDTAFAAETPIASEPDATPDPESSATPSPVPTDATGSDASAPTTADVAPDTPAASSDPAAPEGTPPATDPATATPPAAKPFTFRVDGTDVAPKGATLQPDGNITFTPESFRYLQQHYLGNRTVWREKDAQHSSTIKQLQQSVQTSEQVRSTLLDRVAEVFAGSDDDILDRIASFRQNLPALKAELKAQAAESRLKQIDEERAAVEAERAWKDAEPQWRAGLVPQVQQIATELGATGLNAEALAEELWAMKEDGLIVRAPLDIPEAGIKEGDPVYNLKLIRRELSREKAAQDKIDKAKLAWQQSAALTQRNAATLTPKVTAPPVPGATTPTPVSANGAGSTPKERWRAFLDSEEI